MPSKSRQRDASVASAAKETILVANSQVNVPLAFACLFGLARIGIELYAAVVAVELALNPCFGETTHG